MIFLCTRAINAFNICPLGEARIFTSSTTVVSDYGSLLNKSSLFRVPQEYYPGFILLEIPGAPLRVLGLLSPEASEEDVEALRASPTIFRERFFRDILNPAILSLPAGARTRKNNLAERADTTSLLPAYYRIFPEDLNRLARRMKRRMTAHPGPYRYTLFYCKYGQQQTFTSVTTVRLDSAVVSENLIECSSLHLAVNYEHDDDSLSLFWDRQETGVFLAATGRVSKYPFMGLGELGNVTARNPTGLTTLLVGDEEDSVFVPYVQAYTPFVKPLDNGVVYRDHPFLLTYLLGREFVLANPRKFQAILDSTEKLGEFHSLAEAIRNQLGRCEARFEVVVTARTLAELRNVDLPRLAERVRRTGLLVEVTCFSGRGIDQLSYFNRCQRTKCHCTH